MKNSIGYQLFTRGLVILIFILSIAIVGGICISLLKRTSNKVFTEYIELDAMQEIKIELYHVIIYLDKFILIGDATSRIDFENSMLNCHTQLQHCNEVLTHRHDRTQLDIITANISNMDSLKTVLFSTTQISSEEIDQIHSEIIQAVNEATFASEEILQETKFEIEEYIIINNTAVKHSTITIASIALLLLVIVMVGGIVFIKKITTPISKLVASTKKVRKGKLNTTVEIKAKNEFQTLAESFNEMTSALEKTTISRNYYDSILKNMIEPLIVTDSKGKIKTINHIALQLLQYIPENIKESPIDKIFYSTSGSAESLSFFNELKKSPISNSIKTFLTSSGKQIPVQVSTSTLSSKNHGRFRYIIVAHDLREKIESENKLEKERNEKQIAINDAHEEEKFRIAIDLHDGLGQILTAASYSFQNLFGEVNLDKPEYVHNIEAVQSQIDSAIQESKNIAHNLIPIALKDFGLVVAVNNLIEQANQRCETVFNFETFNYTTRINRKLEKAIFRIFQEAINNIIKHAKAKTANFQINKFDDVLVITIEDDGVGFNLKEKTKTNGLNGIGLIGMRERINAFNGSLTINSKPQEGTDILIEIPCFEKNHG